MSETGDFITKYIGEVIYVFSKGKTDVYKQTFEIDKENWIIYSVVKMRKINLFTLRKLIQIDPLI